MEIRFASTPSYDETSSVLDIVAGIEENCRKRDIKVHNKTGS